MLTDLFQQKHESVTKSKQKTKTFEFSDHTFTNTREGGRLLHPSKPLTWYDPDCVRVENEMLKLSVRYNPNTLRYWDGKDYRCTYGEGSAMSVESFGYGCFDFLVKLPEGKYMYPALWLTGAEAWPPEIDVLEGYNTFWRRKYRTFTKRGLGYKIESNVHYTENGEHMVTGATCCNLKTLNNPTEQFNLYTLKWTPEYIIIEYNNHVENYIEEPVINEALKNKKMHVVMNLSLNTDCDLIRNLPENELIIKSFSYSPMLSERRNIKTHDVTVESSEEDIG